MNVKTTATDLPKATADQKSAAPASTSTPQTVAPASPSGSGAIKDASTPISSTATADTTANEGKNDSSSSQAIKTEKKPNASTKMKIASAIYLRMSNQKDVTRKQIVEQFATEAKLSAAGASTYYQLIKAKLS